MLSDDQVKNKLINQGVIVYSFLQTACLVVEGALDALLNTLVSGSERAAVGAAVSLEKISSHKEVAEEFVSKRCVSVFLKALDEGGDRVQLPISRILFYSKAVKPCFLSNLAQCGAFLCSVPLDEMCVKGEPKYWFDDAGGELNK